MLGRLFDNPVHLLILLLVIVVIFGWKRLPDAARSLGRSARILKSEVGEMQSDASSKTVPGETTTPNAQGATPAGQSVPGEAPTAQAPQAAPQQGQPQYQQPQAPQYQQPQAPQYQQPTAPQQGQPPVQGGPGGQAS